MSLEVSVDNCCEDAETAYDSKKGFLESKDDRVVGHHCFLKIFHLEEPFGVSFLPMWTNIQKRF